MKLDERRIAVSELSDDELQQQIKENGMVLTVDEARKIAKLLGHDPTLTEMHIFNSEWSEHCSYKSSKSTLDEFLPTDGPNVIQGPQEDAGIVFFCEHDGKRYGIVIAHESHNHPSQILPVEGAATGIGGIVRDVDCMGARVIATADPLRFGNPTGENAERTKWIVSGVVDGIWQYGNALGVPCLAGDVYFNDTFDDNCLVNVVALGVVAEEDIVHSAVPPEAKEEQYVIILVGKPTDDSGFGGSAFASKILDEEEQQEDRGAVQVPDAFLENVLCMRKANEAVRERAKELGITIGLKDIGGGGLACGTSEICAEGGFGVELDLDAVHIALPGLLPEVIMCAETQERFVLAVPERFADEVLKIYNEDWDLPNIYEGARAGVIGRVLQEKEYLLKHGGTIVCKAPIDEVTSGISYKREEQPQPHEAEEPEFEMLDIEDALLQVLGWRNVCSRSYVYRSYDMEVQGNAVIRPGEAGAGVIRPLVGNTTGCALAVDSNPAYGDISAYWGGANAVAEAMRNVAAVGATPQAMTDCLNYGNPENPTAFAQFRDGVRGVADAAKNLWLKDHPENPVPCISGNVSLYNESATGRAVSPSAIIACIGTMPDYSKAITMQFEGPGDAIFMAGPRKDELGGSALYQALHIGPGRNVPEVDWDLERNMIHATIDAIDEGLLRACTDISDGGLAVAVAEMCMGGFATGQLGADLDLSDIDADLRLDRFLFSESSGFVMEADEGREDRLVELFAEYGVEIVQIGHVADEPTLRITAGEDTYQWSLDDLKHVWMEGMPEVID